MGKGVAEAMKEATLFRGRSREEQLVHLTKLVHILWKNLEQYEQIIKVIPEGLQIKTGMSEVLVLKNGGIILEGQRILVHTPGKQQHLGIP
jgi:hypothetical protein